jgi:hypothetical protein
MKFGKRKSRPDPAPAQPPALYKPPVEQSYPAPKAPPDEKELRSKVWAGGFVNMDTARIVGIQLPDLIAWSQGQVHLTPIQLSVISRHVGLGDIPVGGLEVIRQALAAKLSGGRTPDWGASRYNRPPDRGVGQGEENPSSAAHAHAIRRFLDGFDDAMTLDQINEFVSIWFGPDAFYDATADVLRRRDAATRMGPPPERFDPEAFFSSGRQARHVPHHLRPPPAPQPPRKYVPQCERAAEWPRRAPGWA